ncbi:MAG TPA: thiol-disulfide oxidoreductase DCC family protein [Methylomirabilota bacterium]|jgi:predicted DCC family thiol-disulfide oxidoreductase YuxK|nr:thiol-disulfide oxidoreductase DCC family protein [Methylomirabilota bacterium]
MPATPAEQPPPGRAAPGRVVLFDGICNLCNATVVFVAKRDPVGRFTFAALQSPVGRGLLGRFGLPADVPETLVLIEEGHAFTRSTAALKIARHLSGLWPLTYAAIVIPRPLRDLVYRLVARHRYRLFGKRDVCMVPSPEVRERFLE